MFGDITSSVLANAPTYALTIAVQAVGLDRCQQNTGRVQSIPSYPDFLSDPPPYPNIFSNCGNPNFAGGIRIKRWARRLGERKALRGVHPRGLPKLEPVELAVSIASGRDAPLIRSIANIIAQHYAVV